MEPITTLNTLHIVATALLLISALVLARRGGQGAS
ncbi:hypothetical protein PSYJA_16712 [Pseudomonas syringae pv. japonica str. M301072]|uniref:Uncharacterized protein n=1 Tax=Pseudomonas syringae pv. japonica str. M301072 TaxID=629262 RepID=F3FJZ1_PSESX|nr:hypothetical protein PSYJA_16712 [Pseudomonas syringae pv. japonica str. M301072]